MKTETKVFSSLPKVCNEWITADHGLTDDKGRKVGGRAVLVQSASGSISVTIQALRDGIAHGASRKPTFYPDAERARAAAMRKLEKQGKRYRDAFDRELSSVPTNATRRDPDGGRLTDEDGIDGPFNRRMERAL